MSLLNMDYLIVWFVPSTAYLQLVTSSNLENVKPTEFDRGDQDIRLLAENALFNWIFDAKGALLGVELQVCPGDGVLEAVPHANRLPYVDDQDPFLFVWFSDRRDGEPRMDSDWLSRIFLSPKGELIAVLGTGFLVWEGEKNQLMKLCSKSQPPN